MRKSLTVAVSVALMGLLAGACGGGSDKDADDKPPAGGGAAPAAVIKASGTTWEPGEVSVKTGETVKWEVTGSIVHDLKGDDEVTHKPGSKFVQLHKYEKAGTYAYQCTIHPGMTGTVTVS